MGSTIYGVKREDNCCSRAKFRVKVAESDLKAELRKKIINPEEIAEKKKWLKEAREELTQHLATHKEDK